MAVAAERKRLFGQKGSLPAGYIVAAVAGIAAVLVHYGLVQWLGTHHLPWAAYYIAVMLIEWGIGWRQAILTALIGLLLGMWVDLAPQGMVHLGDEAMWAHVLGYCGVVTTVIVLAHAAKRRGAELAAVIESMPDAVYIGSAEGITLCNSNALRMLGANSVADLQTRIGDLGKMFEIRWPNTGRVLSAEELQFSRALRGETVIEEVVGKNRETGEDVFIRSACAPILEDGSVIGAVAINSDITARKRAEEALQQSEERLRLSMETAALGLYERDLITNQVRADPNCRRILGIGEAPPAPDIARQSLHPEDRERVLGLVARAFDPALREVCGADFRIIWPNQQVRWVAGRGRVVFDSSTPPRPTKFIGVLQDITERKAMEEAVARSRDQLERLVNERTAKLTELVSELEHMSYSIVHDLRAPLRAIQGFAGLIQANEQDHLSPESRELLSRMDLASRRMDLLITDALNYSRAVQEELPLGPVDVRRILLGTIASYTEFQPPKADIILEGSFPPVLGNEAGLTQCFSNLLGNAVKFVQHGVLPRVRVSAETRQDNSTSKALVRIWFEDNGTGIPRGGETKIFQMFQRMHGPDYPGTGIGLALVRKVAERMGGRVGFEPRPEGGSRFWLEFAAVESAERAA